MIEHIEASVVLFKIRQVCLQNASTAKILATPLPVLMEQLIAVYPYLEGLEWLVNKFWEDETRQTPIEGTPLVDPDGKLWSREAFGDELSDREYLLAERLYALAEWASQLLAHQDFDLSLIIDDYQPQGQGKDLQYGNESLRQWVKDTSLRRLAAQTVKLVFDKELNRWMDTNQAIQDYLANASHVKIIDWTDVGECEQYIQKMWQALDVVHMHCEQARRFGLIDEEQHVADMLWGFVPHDFDDSLVSASREICKVATELMPPQTELRNDILERTYINKVLPKVQQIRSKYLLSVDISDAFSLSGGYLFWWLKKKYWSTRTGMDE